MICNTIVNGIRCGLVGPEGRVVLCDEHLTAAEKQYPQGWKHTPGDICEHGVYHAPDRDCCCGLCEAGEPTVRVNEDGSASFVGTLIGMGF